MTKTDFNHAEQNHSTLKSNCLLLADVISSAVVDRNPSILGAFPLFSSVNTVYNNPFEGFQ